MIGYKVVRHESSDRLYSCIVRNKAQVEYKSNQWVQAPRWLAQQGYYLIFFDSFEAARNFISTEPLLEEIWKCEIKEEIKNLPPRCDASNLGSGIKIESIANGRWPWGTKMAKKIKLIKKVYPKEKK